MKMYKVVLIRHGESVWNKNSRFTGWTDVELSEQGILEAKRAGQLLKDCGFTFDVAHTSVLKRAIKTLWSILEEMNLLWIPEYKTWRLNARHYGNLQSHTKADIEKEVGKDQVQLWRRGFNIRPPELSQSDPQQPGHDPKYKNLDKNSIPLTESLKDANDRMMVHWNNVIVPQIKSDKNLIISAHGSTLRCIIKHLDRISDEDISKLEIPNGIPLVYELNENLTPIKHYYLTQ